MKYTNEYYSLKWKKIIRLVLRKTFGSKGQKVTIWWSKLHIALDQISRW